MNHSFQAKFEETCFFIDPPVDGVPEHFTVKETISVQEGMKVYLHPDTTNDGMTGRTIIFSVTDVSLSVRVKAPSTKKFKGYEFVDRGGALVQEVILTKEREV